MDGFSHEVLSHLPLAEAVLSVLSWVGEEEFLQGVFEKYRGRSYQKVLTFPAIVDLIADALLEHEGSGRQAMLDAETRHEMEATKQAVYGKLRRIPITLSNGFLAAASDRLREVFPGKTASRLPASLRAFEVIAIDGKKIKRIAKRLKPVRGYSGTPLGGKALVALNLRQGLVVAMNAHLDGEVNDAPLVRGLLPQVRERISRRCLWVADRQFCDLTQPHHFQVDNDAYLVRYHPKTKFHRDSQVATAEGVDSQGRRYCQEWGWLGAAGNKKRLRVRRMILFRTDEENIILVSNLTDADQYPATDLLDVYLLRWGIERVFQQVTEVFHLQQLISSTPQGVIFQFGFCLLLYNLVQVVRGYIATAQHRRPETISVEMLFYDIHRELISLAVLAERTTVVNYFQAPNTAKALTKHLEQQLAEPWRDRWIKSPKKKKPKSPVAKIIVKGGHTSIYRILKAAKQQKE